MSRRITFGLSDANYALAAAYAADRHLGVYQIARSALMSEVKRAARRGCLLAELVRQLRPLLASDAQGDGKEGMDATRTCAEASQSQGDAM